MVGWHNVKSFAILWSLFSQFYVVAPQRSDEYEGPWNVVMEPSPLLTYYYSVFGWALNLRVLL